jgi:hypothetical protein
LDPAQSPPAPTEVKDAAAAHGERGFSNDWTFWFATRLTAVGRPMLNIETPIARHETALPNDPIA